MEVEIGNTAAAQTSVARIEGILIGLNAGSGIKAKIYSGIYLWQELLACSIDEQIYVIRENLLMMLQHYPVCADLVNDFSMYGPLGNTTPHLKVQKRGSQ